MKAQTRKGAAVESAVNLVIGFSIAWATNYVALVVFRLAPTAAMLFALGGVVTVGSVIRSYCLRRLFEWMRWRRTPPAFLYIAEELAAERNRQIGGEGYDLAHDDNHVWGQLSDAAAAYCLAAVDTGDGILAIDQSVIVIPGTRIAAIRAAWPWDLRDFKPDDRRRCLIKSGALIIAEIGRLDRAALQRGVA